MRVFDAPLRFFGSGNKVNIPKTLPDGVNYFVLHWDGTSYVAQLPDEDETTYRLGSDLYILRRRFQMWGMTDTHMIDHALDWTRGFGDCAVIPSRNYMVPITSQEPLNPLRFEEEDFKHATGQ